MFGVAENESHTRTQEYFLVHRIDLHTALKQKALSPDGPGAPAKLHTACAVTDVDCDNATITLVDGTQVVGDLIVGADGIHSRSRRAVSGRDCPLFTSGKCGYRWLMPSALLREDPATRLFAEEEGQCVQVAGEDRRIVFYPCSNGEVMNCIGFVPTEEAGPIQKGVFRQFPVCERAHLTVRQGCLGTTKPPTRAS